MQLSAIKGTKPITIPTDSDGQSDEVDLSGIEVEAIMFPAGWTAADLTFLSSNVTGGTFYDVYDSGGTELALTVAASRMIGLTAAHKAVLKALRFVKFRSGDTGTPVAQVAERTLTLVFKSR
jgi:hypothetical protein|tara:strand:+ start:9670 stop:10035 length:366 start_codon:yes stop_codon:yes gene_type:complete